MLQLSRGGAQSERLPLCQDQKEEARGKKTGQTGKKKNTRATGEDINHEEKAPTVHNHYYYDQSFSKFN